jgi:hypothetical protein
MNLYIQIHKPEVVITFFVFQTETRLRILILFSTVYDIDKAITTTKRTKIDIKKLIGSIENATWSAINRK